MMLREGARQKHWLAFRGGWLMAEIFCGMRA